MPEYKVMTRVGKIKGAFERNASPTTLERRLTLEGEVSVSVKKKDGTTVDFTAEEIGSVEIMDRTGPDRTGHERSHLFGILHMLVDMLLVQDKHAKM